MFKKFSYSILVAFYFHLAINSFIIKCASILKQAPTDQEFIQIWDSFKANYSKTPKLIIYPI
jgi:hypothetical protein